MSPIQQNEKRFTAIQGGSAVAILCLGAALISSILGGGQSPVAGPRPLPPQNADLTRTISSLPTPSDGVPTAGAIATTTQPRVTALPSVTPAGGVGSASGQPPTVAPAMIPTGLGSAPAGGQAATTVAPVAVPAARVATTTPQLGSPAGSSSIVAVGSTARVIPGAADVPTTASPRSTNLPAASTSPTAASGVQPAQQGVAAHVSSLNVAPSGTNQPAQSAFNPQVGTVVGPLHPGETVNADGSGTWVDANGNVMIETIAGEQPYQYNANYVNPYDQNAGVAGFVYGNASQPGYPTNGVAVPGGVVTPPQIP